MDDIKPDTYNFVLTRKNQKGQVAIFVALIFQVVFVFFALLVNVGLLVHHKINLQQSTDLAAYYGAMKQAEGLNTIAHVNFQIKQAWKLLTWRYRILGTFGFRASDPDLGPPVGTGFGNQKYPFDRDNAGTNFVYNGSGGLPAPPQNPGGMKCQNLTLNGEELGIQDIPFFCVGHSGFANWSQAESNCQLNCRGFNTARDIGLITVPPSGNASANLQSLKISIENTINNINTNIQSKCVALAPTGAAMLTRFIIAYILETQPRLRTIEALAANLSLDADEVLDIEGNTILSGSLKTFKNNLTEANLAGFQDPEFQIENGLADNKCKFRDGLTGQEFLKKIEFDFINYFIHACKIVGSNSQYKPENILKPDGTLGDPFLPDPITGQGGISPNERATIESMLVNGQRHTVGYEKNPHCVEYYAVKTSATPQIPFLPLTKIKLNAIAVAKPFGGSIGPWYYKTWPKGAIESEGDPLDQNAKTDEALPIKRLNGGAITNTISATVFTQPNFSLYIGDKKGLRDSDYIAAYHSALAVRDINDYPNKTYRANSINTRGQLKASDAPNDTPPKAWPNLSNWAGIDNNGVSDFRDYDTLASNDSDKAGMRALEITAIAPNQFDITHYSIDPDFYNNYYKKLYNTGLSRILDATGKSGSMTTSTLRADFGAVGMRADQPDQPRPLDVKSFSVKDQILLKNIVLDTSPTITNGMTAPNTAGKKYTKILNNLVSLQSSLLTAWTFQGFADYDKFPSGPVDSAANSMSFGQCNNAWNNTLAAQANLPSEDNFRTPMDIDAKLPPTPGNCVTGGRTGYSVKLIAPSMVRDSNKIENPLAESFFNF